MHKLTQQTFSRWQESHTPMTLLDVRRAEKRATDANEIPGAVWKDPAHWLGWKDTIAKDVPAVLYCAHGQEISQALTTALRVLGVTAYYLEEGMAGYLKSGPVHRPAHIL